MTLGEFREQTKTADDAAELVIMCDDTHHVYGLEMVSICMNDPVVMLHATRVTEEQWVKSSRYPGYEERTINGHLHTRPIQP